MIARHGIVEQRSQRAGAVRCHLAESLQGPPRLRAFCSVTGMNLQRGKVELVKIILRLLADRGGELFFLLGKIALRMSEPAGHHVKSCAVAIGGRDAFQRLARNVKLPKTQRSRGKVELAVWIFWKPARNFSTPRYGFFPVLFFCRISQNVESGQRTGMTRPNFPTDLRGFAKPAL